MKPIFPIAAAITLLASTAFAQQATHNAAVGTGALAGNPGDFNTAAGFSAGESSSSSYGTYVGQGAGNSSKDDFSTYLGAGSGIFSAGPGRTALGAVAGRLSNAPYAISIGFAAGQGADGENLIHIGNHAGSPTPNAYQLANPKFDPATKILVTEAPIGLTPTVGRQYRLQFENGSGRAPAGLAAVSAIATVQAVSALRTTWKLDAGADVGAPGYTVGLAYSAWRDDIVIGDGNSDGPGQIRLGFDGTLELVPTRSGTVSLGRSPDEAKSRGSQGVKKWNGLTAKFGGFYADKGEATWIDLGIGDVRRWQWAAEADNGDLSLTAFGADGRPIATPVAVENATGRVKLILPVAENNDDAKRKGLTPTTAYRTPAGAVMVVF